MVPKEKKPHEVIPPSLCLCLCLVLVLVLAQPSGKGPRLPEVYCVISRLGCFGLFSKVRGLSPLPPAPPRCRPPGRSAGSRMGKPYLGRGGERAGEPSDSRPSASSRPSIACPPMSQPPRPWAEPQSLGTEAPGEAKGPGSPSQGMSLVQLLSSQEPGPGPDGEQSRPPWPGPGRSRVRRSWQDRPLSPSFGPGWPGAGPPSSLP